MADMRQQQACEPVIRTPCADERKVYELSFGTESRKEMSGGSRLGTPHGGIVL